MNHDSRSFEDDLLSLKADVAVIRSNYVTKAELQAVRIELKTEIRDVRLDMKAIEANVLRRLDALKMELKEDISRLTIDNEKLRGELHATLNGQTWRIIGAIFSWVVAVYFIARAGY
ncbi:MAG: hypothetical protein V4693_10090 [Pseudomonadota bacterium]